MSANILAVKKGIKIINTTINTPIKQKYKKNLFILLFRMILNNYICNNQ